MLDDWAMGCCAISSLEGLPTDDYSNNEWRKEDWKEFVKDLRAVTGPAMVALNRHQLKAKKELEKRRFKVIGTVQSKEGNGTIWIMARGLKAPRMKRGKHAKRS